MKYKQTRMPSQERRTTILECAKPLFAKKGFENTTTKEIAAAAGISEPILYRHFKNKAALYRELENFCVQNSRSIVEIMNQSPNGSVRLVSAFHLMILSFIGMMPGTNAKSYRSEAETIFRLSLNSLLSDGYFSRHNTAASVEPCISLVLGAWEQARKQGDIFESVKLDRDDIWLFFEMGVSPSYYDLPRKRANTKGGTNRAVTGTGLIRRITLYLLRAAGMKPEAIAKYYPDNAYENFMTPMNKGGNKL